MRKHFESCGIFDYSTDSVSILARSNIYVKLLTLEAIYIQKLKPNLNTKDEYRSRVLTLKF